MSQKIIGMPKKPVFKNLQVHKSNIALTDVSVDIKSYYNRPTKYTTISKYLKNGFQEALWDRPSVAELPNGDRYLYDGDHRRHMYKIAHPSSKTMPARVIKVKDKEEISKLFVQVNKTNKKSLTSSETFIHDVLSKSKHAVSTADFLKAAKLTVSMKTGEVGSFVGAQHGFHSNKPVTANIGRFEKLIKTVNNKKNPIIYSSKVIQSLFKCEHELGTQICGQLLSGLSLVFHHTDMSPDHHLYGSFVKFLQDHQKHVLKQKTFSTSFKDAGYAISNHAEKSVALGIMKLYASNTPEKTNEIKKVFGQYERKLETFLSKG